MTKLIVGQKYLTPLDRVVVLLGEIETGINCHYLDKDGQLEMGKDSSVTFRPDFARRYLIAAPV